MRPYPDFHEYAEQRAQEIVERDAESLCRAGLAPNETLLRALSERASEEITNDYMQEVNATLAHNIRYLIHDGEKQIRQERRKYTRVAYLVFAPLALVLAALAGYSFAWQAPIMGMVYGLGALIALATFRALSSW